MQAIFPFFTLKLMSNTVCRSESFFRLIYFRNEPSSEDERNVKRCDYLRYTMENNNQVFYFSVLHFSLLLSREIIPLDIPSYPGVKESMNNYSIYRLKGIAQCHIAGWTEPKPWFLWNQLWSIVNCVNKSWPYILIYQTLILR